MSVAFDHIGTGELRRKRLAAIYPFGRFHKSMYDDLDFSSYNYDGIKQ